jgi:cytochrome c oxidase accessory protein FixG
MRDKVQVGLILFFLILPWIQISGRQALLLDVANRKFEIFGLSLRAHNAPLFFFVLAAAGFGLFFVTSIWGRVWCGWACPQTVFIDGVYRRIERWIEGPALERRRLDQGPWSAKKFGKRTAKWTLYVIASLIITHSFLAYFVGTDELARMVTRSPSENWTSFLFICFSTAIILFDFAWFREQFCIIACPYGRFQSVLMDDASMIVAYDTSRGEPRQTPQAKALSKTHNSKLGDCVNCYRCVQVCPTGIDIRRGVQLECVACTSCIDACDEVMTKLKKPTGLIRYDSLLGLKKTTVSNEPTHADDHKQTVSASSKPRFQGRLRARSILYFSIMAAALTALSFFIGTLKPVDITVLRAKETPYTVSTPEGMSSPVITNHFKIELSNQSDSLHHLHFDLEPSLKEKGAELITAHRPFLLPAGKFTHADVFIRFPKSLLIRGSKEIIFMIEDRDPNSGESHQYLKEVTLVGPLG